MDKLLFQYCQKIVVFSADEKSILLCRRIGEADYNNAFSFIGGKMEVSDENILEGLRREKNEEVGKDFKIKIFADFSANVLFHKKDGNAMILPHYLAIHESGEIILNEEYSEYAWVPIEKINDFEPKIQTIPVIIKQMQKLQNIINKKDLITI